MLVPITVGSMLMLLIVAIDGSFTVIDWLIVSGYTVTSPIIAVMVGSRSEAETVKALGKAVALISAVMVGWFRAEARDRARGETEIFPEVDTLG